MWEREIDSIAKCRANEAASSNTYGSPINLIPTPDLSSGGTILDLDFPAYLEARLFKYLTQVAVPVHRTDVIGPTDGPAAQDHIREGTALGQAREHGFDEVAVVWKRPGKVRCSVNPLHFLFRSVMNEIKGEGNVPRRSTSMILGGGERS